MAVTLRALITLCVLAMLYYGAERVIVYPLDPRYISPAAAGLPELQETRDGSMVVWRSEPQRGRPTILYLQGNAGHLADRKGRFERFMARGYGLVAPAYRGGSGSEGWPYEGALTDDISELYEAELNHSTTDLIVYGESIGAAVALQVLADASIQPRAVVLEAPFTSLRDVARQVYPGLIFATGLMLSHWDSLAAAPHLRSPLLIIHGARDQLVPVAQGRAVFEAAGSMDKLFHEVPAAAHVNVWTVGAQRVLFDYLGQF